MKYKFEHFSLIAILFCFIASSCGNQKFLRSHSLSPEKPRKRVFDEYMVVKNKFNFLKQNYKIQEDFDNLSYELSSILQQSPDRSLIRAFRQWVYHLNDTLSYPYKYNKEHKAIMLDTVERKPNGLQKWLYNKVGSGPMILDTALTRRTAESMQRFLNQKSYFNAEVSYDIRKVRHRAIVTYNIKTGMPLLIDTVSWLSKDTLIKEILEDIKGLTVLKPRATISSNNLSLEKKRLTLAIRNRGYYNFNWNYIVIQADTANAVKVNAHKKSMFNKNFEQGEPRAKIYLEVLPFSDTSISHPIYNICNVYITPNDLILKAHQKRVIKKDSFFVVERTIRDRQKILVLKGDDIIQPKDIIRKEKIRKNGEKIRWVERSVPRLKKVTLNSRNDILPGDKVIHIILRKIVKNKKDEEANVKQKKKKYYIRDKVISDAVSIKAGDLYMYKGTQESVHEINNLGVFRFPRIEYVPTPNGPKECLDCLVKMQPGKKQEFGVDFEVNNNATTVYSSTIGLATNIFYRNKNIFKGAEVFEVSVQGGVDLNVNPDSTTKDNLFAQTVNLLDVNFETSFYFPRFLGFKFLRNMFKMENPSTKLSLGYHLLKQSSDFQISSFYTKIGYEWTKGNEHAFKWNPALVNLTLEPTLDDNFAKSLEENNLPLYESLKASFLIPSMDFSYTYSTPENKLKGGAWFFKSYFEVSGNLVYLLDKLIDPNKKLQFLGVDYSQYFRTELDIRYSYKLHKRHSVISRLMLGVIVPYGNSEGTDIPFIKRFTLGGPSSMRAWNLRYLGPGNNVSSPGAEFQLGDLRFEFNSEYRFMFNSWIGGAFFVDIGNVWLFNSAYTDPGIPLQTPKTGAFSDKFYEQLAVGTGVGLRVDLSFFIFRFDFALQLREPEGYRYRSDGTIQYWNFDPFEIENRHKFIIAIGYPF